METVTHHHVENNYSSNVDTSSPFRSVKEAVAIFGERLLTGELYTKSLKVPYDNNTTISSWKYTDSPQKPKITIENNPGNHEQLLGTLKKLEAELTETKTELSLLKERESETEIAVASLNAELHRNMAKLARVEADAAAKSAKELTKATSFDKREVERRRSERSFFALSHMLSTADEEGGYFGETKKSRVMKKKPIVPLLGDLFFSKKKRSSGSNTNLRKSMFASPQLHLN